MNKAELEGEKQSQKEEEQQEEYEEELKEEDEEDLYEGLEAEQLEARDEKPLVPKLENITVFKKKEFKYDKTKSNLFRKLTGINTLYTKKEPRLYFGAPQIKEEPYREGAKREFLLLLNLFYFISDEQIKDVCDEIGSINRVVILEDENSGKSLGICLLDFSYLDNLQNYVMHLKEKLKVEVKKLDPNLEEQIKSDEIYNCGGYLDRTIIQHIKKIYLNNYRSTEIIGDSLNKPLNVNKHPLFNWFDTNIKDVLNTYVENKLQEERKHNKNTPFVNKDNDDNSDSDSDVSTHILSYVSKRNKFGQIH